MEQLLQQFLHSVQNAPYYEWIGVVFGILSVWFSKKENILVYPVGLVNTILYVYISLEAHLAGEAAVNLYYTIVSLYGWYLWNKKKKDTHQPVLHISYLNKKELTITLIFFASLYLLLYLSLTYIKNAFWYGAIPWADALASSAAFVSMYLMAKKKVESWIGWIITNVVSAPLYFVKDLSLTSVYYVILLILAILGFLEWQKKANAEKQHV